MVHIHIKNTYLKLTFNKLNISYRRIQPKITKSIRKLQFYRTAVRYRLYAKFFSFRTVFNETWLLLEKSLFCMLKIESNLFCFPDFCQTDLLCTLYYGTHREDPYLCSQTLILKNCACLDLKLKKFRKCDSRCNFNVYNFQPYAKISIVYSNHLRFVKKCFSFCAELSQNVEHSEFPASSDVSF